MIKKIVFAGCSITAGNELWEEAHVPNYASMTFKESRKMMNNIPNYEEVTEYNKQNAFPNLIGKALGVETFNLGFSGISNKELALRVIAHFTEDHYDDTIVVMQFTTHNRMLLKYKEDKDVSTYGSFVVMPNADDNRLSKHQNNLLKEMFFEFLPESLLATDDHIFFYYAAEALKQKGISVYMLWTEIEIVNWASWDIDTGYDDKVQYKCINDKDPQWGEIISKHFAHRHHDFNLLGTTLQNVAGPDSRLPRLHFKKSAHETIATKLSEKLKCLIG
jgi:hypothetical protein